MTQIVRKTKVVSISIPPKTAAKLDEVRKKKGQSRSAFITSLIEKEVEDERWETIYKWGRETAKKFKITSEDDIDRILHEED
ncbi:hypothetical protein A2962_00805 [Candidatus Woesebacteria bacterium RIFCSPLOWO2_01_FULL_39_61]|uniref:Ribbon-helix-helix protein CopG domain-containing protein n=1 Tax=Candidatus Woesebacteria bacterium RIFCSPHIGHO2_02_FULL_39_13 TaxID=1802505 RepID=A0A1F7Z6L3_9BACT|nr:MAG: hypothetical protein A2692_02950 [Candidatus Woesebacteria bacterium RIFCSPHIGHO2_01_FULL_39_95]OGM34415.1 MAG: hypothetical protein A3D01_05585 [Candidatus Woesebacteria bacterium RIFCSPHIGHO2_02_FULL_39_13]OGM36232.1 MAG: hypothetical protein A3E13_02745 [Candidatus Woesebacteria bacterium RIFCSPHIGHO2_12_FULL_40_20]OGM68280.1 MAG: hypothetical protein A2962_00805 [Candidatus Woesebacteria bacterium RIFCSPLOWO2_01_FULL_39_61]OGM74224.1 MAG: hypothetical protein A3H19_05500 [Candidatus